MRRLEHTLKLSSKELSDKDSKQVFKMPFNRRFERLGDHAVNLSNAARKCTSVKSTFRIWRRRSLRCHSGDERYLYYNAAFMNDDIELAAKVEPLEQVIDRMITEIWQTT